MTFKDLIDHPGILQAIEEAGFTQPTPIQQQAIPEVLRGSDLLASAQTGTGKTAAFILPVLCRMTTPSALRGQGPRVLILVPTRELAMQVANEALKYSKHLSKVKTVCIFGGAPYHTQSRELSRPYEILVATPGRLIDYLEQGRIEFSRIELLILDEADRMLDMGFIGAVEQIAAAIPTKRQTLMFSATLKGQVLTLSKRLLNQPVEISVTPEHTKHENIEQSLYTVDNIHHKYRLLDYLLNSLELEQAIVFTSTKHQADQLVYKLAEAGQQAAALHGGMRQGQRTRTLQQMRRGLIRVLVATDVAARGIDVPTISHVINFDLPMSVEDYVHRIGRTGRAGANGIALSFVTAREMGLIRRIERFTGQKISTQSAPAGFEARAKPSFVQPQVNKPQSAADQPKNPPKRGFKPGWSSTRPSRQNDTNKPRSDRSSKGRPFARRESK